jgi:hypothetical protein
MTKTLRAGNVIFQNSGESNHKVSRVGMEKIESDLHIVDQDDH